MIELNRKENNMKNDCSTCNRTNKCFIFNYPELKEKILKGSDGCSCWEKRSLYKTFISKVKNIINKT